MNANEGRELGEELAECGIQRAAIKHEAQIRRGSWLFLNAILASPDGCATTDAATDAPLTKYPDGGRWRGSIPKRLKAAGLIVSFSLAKSERPARHAGYLAVWQLIDRPAAEVMRAALAADLKIEAAV